MSIWDIILPGMPKPKPTIEEVLVEAMKGSPVVVEKEPDGHPLDIFMYDSPRFEERMKIMRIINELAKSIQEHPARYFRVNLNVTVLRTDESEI